MKCHLVSPYIHMFKIQLHTMNFPLTPSPCMQDAYDLFPKHSHPSNTINMIEFTPSEEKTIPCMEGTA